MKKKVLLYALILLFQGLYHWGLVPHENLDLRIEVTDVRTAVHTVSFLGEKAEKFCLSRFLTSGAGELAGKPTFGLCCGEAETAVLTLTWCSPRAWRWSRISTSAACLRVSSPGPTIVQNPAKPRHEDRVVRSTDFFPFSSPSVLLRLTFVTPNHFGFSYNLETILQHVLMLYIRRYLQYTSLILYETRISAERVPNAQKELTLPQNPNKHMHKQQQ